MRCQAALQLVVLVQVKSMGWKNEENSCEEIRGGIVVSKTTAGLKEPSPGKGWKCPTTEIISQNLWR